MVKSSVIQYSLIVLVLGLAAAPKVQALGTEMFVCTGTDGVRTYQNSDGGDGCVPLNLNPITVVPAPRSASKSGGISEPASGGVQVDVPRRLMTIAQLLTSMRRTIA